MTRYTQRTELHDCTDKSRGADNELLIVEGDSASKSVLRFRSKALQAVLPMQGKPMNARKGTEAAVRRNPLLRHLVQAIDAGFDASFDVQCVAYRRVALLFDPDADGIHCGVLMSLFFHRWMPGFIEAGLLHVIRAPLFELEWFDGNLDRQTAFAFTDEDLTAKRAGILASGFNDISSKRYRGLGSLPGDVLHQTCLNPSSRFMHPITLADVDSMIRIFCPS